MSVGGTIIDLLGRIRRPLKYHQLVSELNAICEKKKKPPFEDEAIKATLKRLTKREVLRYAKTRQRYSLNYKTLQWLKRLNNRLPELEHYLGTDNARVDVHTVMTNRTTRGRELKS